MSDELCESVHEWPKGSWCTCDLPEGHSGKHRAVTRWTLVRWDDAPEPETMSDPARNVKNP